MFPRHFIRGDHAVPLSGPSLSLLLHMKSWSKSACIYPSQFIPGKWFGCFTLFLCDCVKTILIVTGFKVMHAIQSNWSEILSIA